MRDAIISAVIDTVVLISFVALVLSALLLFALGTRIRAGHWLFSLALGSAVAAGSWWGTSLLLAPAIPLAPVVAGGLILTACVAAAFDDWTSCGHLALAATLAASVAFLVYAAMLLVTTRLGPWSLAFGALLFLLQLAAHALVWTHTFEILDVMCRRTWRRRNPALAVQDFYPKVSLHVPTHNEPPELVRLTLDALASLDYPNYEVLVIDNNTDDEAVWRPVEKHCLKLGPRFRFFHLRPWPGYKSGALNFALTQTAPDVEIIAVVDADYIVRPDFLSSLAGHFADPAVAFVQTPQDYREVEDRGRYGRALYLAYRVFFDLSMPSRNERNAIIYAGTMGLLRRSALEKVGGWDEWCITEDAELSLRLLAAGYQSIFIPESYGHGLMPLDFAGLKKQRFRWAFGGMQILRMHARELFALRRTRLNVRQRAAYIVGGLQWLNDPLTFAFTVLLLIGGAALAAGGSIFLQPLAGAAIFIPSLFVLVSVLRFLWAFRNAARCSVREAFDALTVLLALTWVVTLACILGLVKSRGVFLRTPKAPERVRVLSAVRVVLGEFILGSLCLIVFGAIMLTGPLDTAPRAMMLGLLGWQALIYFSALRTSIWSYQAHPERQPRFLWRDYHTTGPRTGPFVPEWRTAVAVAGIGLVIALFFYVALRSAPTIEMAMRGDPLRQHTLVSRLIRPSPKGAAGALLVQEAEAVQKGDIRRALELWDPAGVVHDNNFTPSDSADDRIWEGLSGVQARYEAELEARRYRRLRHRNLTIEIRGDEAVIQNDLDALIETPTGAYSVQLPRSDRWFLKQQGGRWRVVRLEINRSPADAGTGLAARKQS